MDATRDAFIQREKLRGLPGFAAFLRPRVSRLSSSEEEPADQFAAELRRFSPPPSAPPAPPSARPAPPTAAAARFLQPAPGRYHDYLHRHHPAPRGYEDANPPSHRRGLDSLRMPATVLSTPTPSPSSDRAPRKSQKLEVDSSPSDRPPAVPAAQLSQQHQQQPSDRRPPARMSRYLREVDRRTILQRIENGEKQADLAKEYQVSRAAISNLKQRRRLKERQRTRGANAAAEEEEEGRGQEEDGDDNGGEEVVGAYDLRHLRNHSSDDSVSSEPVADDIDDDHYQEERRLVRATGPSSSSSSSPFSSFSSFASSPLIHQLQLARSRLAPLAQYSPQSSSRAALACEVHGSSMAHLLTQLQLQRRDDAPSSAPSYRVAAQRLTRLLLEETLSRLPTRPVELAPRLCPASSREANLLSSDERCVGVAYASTVCAVAISGRDGDGDGSQLLLEEFREMEPSCRTCVMMVEPTTTTSSSTRFCASFAQPPPQLADGVVLLLGLVGSASGDEICAALQTLEAETGVALRNVFVATLVGYESGLARVLDAFPTLGALLTTKALRPPAINSPDLAQQLLLRLTLK